MRIDRLLCFLRLAKSRGAAQRWISEGHIRCNGQRVVRLDRPIATGDILTLPLPKRVMVLRLTALPARRGSPAEARSCYEELDAGGSIAIAGTDSHFETEKGKKQP
ncbi:RNA-binding S4 domain-containing protein [Altererythrobacter indicus]|uniref:RNA-binding S4 domain-containing protein n=1 Tax=Altericroceibacterium indicum TaxID=374177 RepID=A0A845AAV7_9SPHN|nr:S4 domain-containing protein [Altericroceibacterium indicum]MXP26489.1 RNA-binding S4 domain-containing protein [Altericroceibacterium indicum]